MFYCNECWTPKIARAKKKYIRDQNTERCMSGHVRKDKIVNLMEGSLTKSG